jgi:Putative transposase
LVIGFSFASWRTFSCKARAVCPSCLGRRMNEGALNLVTHVLPASKRILRFLQRREVITLVTTPGDGEVTVVSDESMAEKDPLLAQLLAAATAGAPPAGWAQKRKPVRIVLDPDDRPVAKGKLCSQAHGFNLHAATKVAANDKQGRLTLCKYILRPSFANDRLQILDDGNVRLDFKKPWSDGTTSVELAPLAFIARLAALVPPPKRHTVRYFGCLSSHAAARSQVVPVPAVPTTTPAAQDKPKNTSRYISWSELLRRTFGFEILCSTARCPRGLGELTGRTGRVLHESATG